MLIEILTHTPTWVFALFALLAWLGGKQLVAGSTHLARVTAMPLAMVALAIYGVSGAFGRSDAGWPAGAWPRLRRWPLSPGCRCTRPCATSRPAAASSSPAAGCRWRS